ncbi:hypothetical protein DV738_g5413, partial [Chaetothyriales sp. CBS 135597]
MTALVAHQPVHAFSMSTTQRPPRRLSARLQEKGDAPSDGYPAHQPSTSKNAANTQSPRGANPRKRKNAYDEEDDGFAFTRVRKKSQKRQAIEQACGRKRASRWRGRAASENERDQDDIFYPKFESTSDGQANRSAREQSQPNHGHVNGDTSTTRIALPFADTPVIRRNKEMRGNKSSRSERRSSLGMRGRRASSLIETGNSNALPHAEVDVQDFYKHIEASGLSEPRRMRQLLTWCATRAMDQKAVGVAFEEASAIAAARLIEEELLKDLSNQSELSNWFGREDTPPAVTGEQKEEAPAIPERPNPKNEQNAAKIVELEEQIKRLRAEKEALEALLRPPSVPKVPQPDAAAALDTCLLSDSDKAAHESLTASTNMAQDIASRLNALRQTLGPTVDLFASSVHSINQYREAADDVATRVLSLCAQKLQDREKEGRRRAAEKGANPSPRADLAAVLRGLSRLDADS